MVFLYPYTKAEAEITINTERIAVRENLMDVLTHEYGHFIHRHAETDYVQKKNVFGAKQLGGSLRNDWVYDINKKYSREAKIRAAEISKYATKNPYETFAEGFLATEKGQKIPEEIASVIEEAKQRAGVKTVVANASDSGIIKMYRKSSDLRKSFKFISDETFEKLTISARKKGAIIIRGTKEAEEHLDKMGAAASNIGDVLLFRKDVCISEVLEETYHFEQNILKLNEEEGEPLRSILNEIDAKKYLLENAKKYKIPRNEIELTHKQLKSYERELAEWQQKKGGVRHEKSNE